MNLRSLDILTQVDTFNYYTTPTVSSIAYFDMSQVVWSNKNASTNAMDDLNVFLYVTEDEDSMRLDIICNKIYGNTDNIDFLMFLNDIVNPLTIVSGQSIYYATADTIANYQVEPDVLTNVKNQLINISKAKRVDKNRSDYQQTNNLPPTISTGNTTPIQFENNQVIVGRGLFNS